MLLRMMAVVLAVLGFFALTAAPAQAALNDAVIKNQSYSYYTITVCKDAASDTSCVSGHYGFLSPGQNTKSKYGWTDADGMWCPAGWWCQVFSSTFRGSGSGWGSRFLKISGCNGCTAPVYVYKDNG